MCLSFSHITWDDCVGSSSLVFIQLSIQPEQVKLLTFHTYTCKASPFCPSSFFSTLRHFNYESLEGQIQKKKAKFGEQLRTSTFQSCLFLLHWPLPLVGYLGSTRHSTLKLTDIFFYTMKKIATPHQLCLPSLVLSHNVASFHLVT